ncbi:hypothetical protein NST48_01515 [Paenibacillus sp. FSL M7-0547]|uniref:hypothetical protein n=1 Tax=Paenibacillus sp. FSL M7-0547 TaxID=2954755 RepID=UPI0030FB4D8D
MTERKFQAGELPIKALLRGSKSGNPKDMTDQQLNRALAELMGYTVRLKGSCYWLVNPTGEESANPFGRNSEEIAWTWVPDYCTDPAASLELQAKAIEVDARMYAINLAERLTWDSDGYPLVYDDNDLFSYTGVANFLLSSPRERAEAAYITLQAHG